jgi:hypothetical protein
MGNLWSKPYKEVETTKGKVVSIIAFGLFIFLFLFVFKPFGLYQISPVEQFYITLGFGLVTTFMLFIFKYLLQPVVTRKNWTFGKSIIWVLSIASGIGVANYIYISVVFHQQLEFKYFLFSIWTTILVGSIPVTISYMVNFNRLYKEALKNPAITSADDLWESEVTLRAGNPRNEYKVNPKCIVYLCSNDNYVTIVTNKEETITKTHLRGTLKAAEAELKMNSGFIRCHKCFIVNSAFVDHATGNAQNMKIKLRLPGPEIPVSRSRAAYVLKKIK